MEYRSESSLGLDACKMYKQERVLAVSHFLRGFPVIRYCLKLWKNSTRSSKKPEHCLILMHLVTQEGLGFDYVAIAEAVTDALSH